MNNKQYILILIIFSIFSIKANAQTQPINPGNEIIKYYEHSNIPAYYKFSGNTNITEDQFISWIDSKYQLNSNISFQLEKTEIDQLGLTKNQYIQNYNHIPIENSRYSTLARNGQIISVFGLAFDEIKISNVVILSEQNALDYALNLIDANTFMWELAGEEKVLQEFEENPQATYYPKGELVLVNPEGSFKSNHVRYAWKFNIYAHEPLSRAWYYVDAQTGKILLVNSILHNSDVPATAITKFSGSKQITTDSTGPGSYRLREVGRGKGIETYNLQTGTSYASAVDFEDTDNYWNNVNTQKDEIATDAHWGTEMTYDYFLNKHNRNSIDNDGFKLRSYLHYSTNYSNAFWNGQWMTYGDGNASSEPFVALDIIGHEISHGLTTNTADLIYALESGALNEGFSDIFGNMIERFAKPTAYSWEMGEDIGYVLRDMSNPNSKGDPDTYEGLYWVDTKSCVPTQVNDNCGVHTNSSVLNYWFYLLVEGGRGTNDHNNTYQVSNIGSDKASAIAFRCLTIYLSESSDYMDARFYSARAAADLYGECSSEVEAVLDAWYAVGVGGINRSVNFEASTTASCTYPFTVEFKNLSDAYSSFLWDFGDGDTSSSYDPIHTFNSVGTYDIKLVAQSICGNDSIVKTGLIVVDTNMPCIFTMPTTGSPQTVNLCKGKLFDDGGSQNYTGNQDILFTISPIGAASITLDFISFAFEGDCDCDWLYIYDGDDITSPLIGKYSGFDLPNGGSISSTGGSITIRQYTDPLQTYSGFELNWYCSAPNMPPDVDFKVNVPNACNGLAHFKSITANGPTSWTWDFGDGKTSSSENPVHEYQESGLYAVKLICSNDIGTDSLTKTNFVLIDRPNLPSVSDFESCGETDVTLIASGSGKIKWFDHPQADMPIHIGDSLDLGNVTSSISYYAVNDFSKESVYGGPEDISIGTGRYFTGDQGLIFDVFKPAILKSVKVFASGEADRTIILKDENGTIIHQKVLSIPDGESRITLDFELAVGSNFRLGSNAGSNLYRNNSGTDYPYELDSILTITGSSASQAGFYYFYYDWEVSEPACFSGKKEVNIWIDDNPQAVFTYTKNLTSVDFKNNSAHARKYRWDFGDGNSSEMENPTHTYSSNGSYTVKLVISNSCGSDSVYQTIGINTSLKDAAESIGFRVYPIPADQILTIEINKPSSTKYTINILSAVGQIVYTDVFSDYPYMSKKVYVNQFAKGMYFVQLQSADEIITKQIIIK
ncbi:MAG: PKD domain-containing protein [Bacteroidetes bacterium]|nr:PKD domain-containing protein [Bacteroidota bacterium]